MRMFTYTEQELSRTFNEVKEMFLRALANYGEFDQQKADELNARYSLVAFEKGFWGKAYDKLTGIQPDKLYIRVVQHSEGTSETDNKESVETPNA